MTAAEGGVDSAAGVPAMSVVLLTPDGLDTITTTLLHLQAQSARALLEIIIVAPALEAVPRDAPVLQDFAGVVVVPFAALSSAAAAARAAGVHAARAPVVVFAEDHSFPQPGWADALIRAHREPW